MVFGWRPGEIRLPGVGEYVAGSSAWVVSNRSLPKASPGVGATRSTLAGHCDASRLVA